MKTLLTFPNPLSDIFRNIIAAVAHDLSAEVGGTEDVQLATAAARAALPVNEDVPPSPYSVGQVFRYGGDVRVALDMAAGTIQGLNVMVGLGNETGAVAMDAAQRSLVSTVPITVVLFAAAHEFGDVVRVPFLMDDIADHLSLNLCYPTRLPESFGLRNLKFIQNREVTGTDLSVARAILFEGERHRLPTRP